MSGMARKSVIVVIAGMLLSLASALAAHGPLPLPTASAQYDNCGFHPLEHRRIEFRRHISCARAKRVLLRLKGDRATIPMVCGRSRVIQGWRVSNPERLFGVVSSTYRRGRVSFEYDRVDHIGERAWCPPKDDEYGHEGV